jgi:hypothetical protein
LEIEVELVEVEAIGATERGTMDEGLGNFAVELEFSFNFEFELEFSFNFEFELDFCTEFEFGLDFCTELELELEFELEFDIELGGFMFSLFGNQAIICAIICGAMHECQRSQNNSKIIKLYIYIDYKKYSKI